MFFLLFQLSSNFLTKMPTYYWKFQELFSKENNVDVYIELVADNSIKAKNIIMNYIMKMSRFGIPKIVLTHKGKTAITHSNDARARNLPYVNIDYALFQKILCLQPSVAFELNHMASPFIPLSRD